MTVQENLLQYAHFFTRTNFVKITSFIFGLLSFNIWEIVTFKREWTFRSSRREVFFKNGVLRNFTKFTGKYLCQSRFFNKATGLRPATLFKKRFWHRSFPVNFVKFLRTPFFIEHFLVAASWRYKLKQFSGFFCKRGFI